MGLSEGSKGSETALPQEYEGEGGDGELDTELAKKYRRVVATVNYLARDRADLQFAAGVLKTTAARPTSRSWVNLKRVARRLVSHPRMISKIEAGRWSKGPGLAA